MGRAEIVEGEDRVWVSVERMVNLGNYQNVKLIAGASKSLPKGADPVETARDLFDEFETLVQDRTEEYE